VTLSNRALLQFGAGIAPIGIAATQAGEDLVLTVSASDSVRVKDWFNSANYRLGQIQFDGLPAQDATTFVATLLNPPD
ncbi:MAG: calcium-binding protein, partial [Ketobacter sp.]